MEAEPPDKVRLVEPPKGTLGVANIGEGRAVGRDQVIIAHIGGKRGERGGDGLRAQARSGRAQRKARQCQPRNRGKTFILPVVGTVGNGSRGGDSVLVRSRLGPAAQSDADGDRQEAAAGAPKGSTAGDGRRDVRGARRRSGRALAARQGAHATAGRGGRVLRQ